MRAGALRRQLGLLGTVSVSVGVMAPTLAMSATGVEPARLLGRAAPLAYVVAAIGVGLVAYGFTRLAGAFSSAGSVYAFAGRTLGPRTGFVTGWALLGTYLVYPAVSISAIAIFGQAFLKSTGIAPHAPWFPIALAGWAVIGWIASREIRTAARSLLAIEVASMALILVLMAIIVVKLATGGAPHGQALSLDVFALPSGTALSTVALAATFGFLSFAGFEAAGSLGEESDRPTSAIPRSLVAAIAVGAGLGCASVAARMLYALGRDRRLPETLAGVSGTGAPAAGLAFVLTLDLLGLIAFAAAGTPAQKVFFYLATIGVLELLVMYAITNVAAVRFLLERGRRREALLPIAGIAVAGYVFYRNVWPVPASPFNLFPYVVAAWLAIGIVVAITEIRVPAPARGGRRWRRA